MKTYSVKQVARAAGVRTSLVKKYVRQGVRGTGSLAADESGRVSVTALEYFASVHHGSARQIARRALENLGREKESESIAVTASADLEAANGAAQ